MVRWSTHDWSRRRRGGQPLEATGDARRLGSRQGSLAGVEVILKITIALKRVRAWLRLDTDESAPLLESRSARGNRRDLWRRFCPRHTHNTDCIEQLRTSSRHTTPSISTRSSPAPPLRLRNAQPRLKLRSRHELDRRGVLLDLRGPRSRSRSRGVHFLCTGSDPVAAARPLRPFARRHFFATRLVVGRYEYTNWTRRNSCKVHVTLDLAGPCRRIRTSHQGDRPRALRLPLAHDTLRQ